MDEAKLKKLEKYSSFEDDDKGFTMLQEMESIGEKLDAIASKEAPEVQKVEILGAQVVTIKGKDGEDGKDSTVPGPKGEPGEPGKDYILTEKDKTEIAGKIKVPIVEKIVEKIEVIKEQPIVTEVVKEVAIAENGEQIVNRINALPTDDDNLKIDISHVKGWKDYERDITNLKNRPMGAIVGRDVIKDYDLSSRLDGVTKTFNIPAVWNIVSVSLSSYPYGSLRKGIDYTWTPTSITFTSEIDAATQLASGQKCILVIVSG